MRRKINTLLAFVLCFYTLALAASKPDDYAIAIHVVSSRWVMEPTILGGLGALVGAFIGDEMEPA